MPDAARLFGAWRLTAAYVVTADKGEHRPSFGDAPRGYLVFEPGGRMIALLSTGGRQAASTEAARAGLFQSMMSYSGRFRIEDDRFVTSVDLAWEPSWEGTEQVRYYTLSESGDALSIRTAPSDHPLFPSEKIVAWLEWVRD